MDSNVGGSKVGGKGGSAAAGKPGAPSAAAAKGAVSAALKKLAAEDKKVLAYKDDIVAASKKYGVPAPLVAGVLERESGGDPDALSLDGGHGKGLMQIDDRSHAFARGPDAFDPAKNIAEGAKILAGNAKAFPGNEDAQIAAYNAGVGGVKKAMKQGLDPGDATYAPGYVEDVEANEKRLAPAFEDPEPAR
ncbi:MAG TPA: transglycosylase SLT domain-containing protein [Planctomycetota bacterium]|nr:transglycosylase SLT domain-containing protein [Planctomycetota bacterium]